MCLTINQKKQINISFRYFWTLEEGDSPNRTLIINFIKGVIYLSEEITDYLLPIKSDSLKNNNNYKNNKN